MRPEPTRIAVAAPDRVQCGVADYARQLAAALPSRFETTSLTYPGSSSRRAWTALARQADGAQLVHLHYETSLFHTVSPLRNRYATFLRAMKPPAVVTLHGLLPNLQPTQTADRSPTVKSSLRRVLYGALFRDWERQQYRFAKLTVVHGQQQLNTVSSMAGPGTVTRLVMPSPATTVSWQLRDRPAMAQTLVTPGFTKPHKGYARVLEAIRLMPSNVEWTIAGAPQDERDRCYLEELEQLIGTLGLTEQIKITGYLASNTLEQTMARACAAIFPFHRSSGSASVAWAIALGMPVIASDIPIFNELVREGAGIEILPTSSPEVWAKRLTALLEDRSRLEVLAQSNRAFAQQHSYASAGEVYGTLFDRVLDP